MTDDPTTTEARQKAVARPPKDFARVSEAWKWEQPFLMYFEWAETALGGRRHLTVYLVFQCGDERSESIIIDEDVTDTSSFQYGMMVDGVGPVLQKHLPAWLIQCAEKHFAQAGDISVRESPFIPPRNNSDWSFPKLHNAAAEAANSLRRAYKPVTLENAAEVINRRYKLKTPLTKDALRMLLKRHGVDWKEIKRAFGKKRTPPK